MPEKKRVFIVDDDEVVLQSLKRMLELSGFEVSATNRSIDAVDRIKAFNPHVILLDLLMPVIGGLEVCELLNQDPELQGIPVIVVSALAGQTDVKKAYKLGVVGYITKPYELNQVLFEINKAIATKYNL
jgi:two-component system OmpR family response regulator